MKGRRYFYLTSPSCLNTGLFLSLPPKMHSSWDLVFPASASIFSGNNRGARGVPTLPGFLRKLSRAWAQMVKGGRLGLAGPPANSLSDPGQVCVLSEPELPKTEGRWTYTLESCRQYRKASVYAQSQEAPPGLCAAELSSPSHTH